MMSINLVDQVRLIAFWLCFTRVVIVFVHLPMMDEINVPMMVKVMTSFILSYAFFPYVEGILTQEIRQIGFDNYWYLMMVHTLIALVMGQLIKLIMNIFVSAGSMMSQQIGFTSVTYFDPHFVTQIGPIEKIIQYSLLVMLVSSGGLLPMFKGLYSSFFTLNSIELVHLKWNYEMFDHFFMGLFSSSLMLAGPIFFCNLLVNLVLGIMARSVPQMNIMMVSFAINISLGLFILFAISTEFFSVAYTIYLEKLNEWLHLMG